jgi:hypothetical protein
LIDIGTVISVPDEQQDIQGKQQSGRCIFAVILNEAECSEESGMSGRLEWFDRRSRTLCAGSEPDPSFHSG